MTTTNFFKVIICTAALLMASCSENEQPPIDRDRTALAVDAGIVMQTKATDASWQAGDMIGVFMTTAGTTEVSDNVANLPYVAAGEGKSTVFSPATEASTAYYPVGKAAVDVRAYYPHAAGTTDAGIVTVNLSDQRNLAAIDLMTAASETTHSSENPSVPLTFRHRLAKLVVKLKTDASIVNVALPGAEVTLSGTAIKATYSLFDDKLTADKTADLTLAVNTAGTEAKAIVMPTEAGSGVSFIIKTATGKTFTAPLPEDFELEEGAMATVTITLRQTDATVEAAITEWSEGPEAEIATLKVEMPAGPTGEPAVEYFILTKNGDAANAVAYSWIDGEWVTDKPSFKVEDLKDTDRFTAVHTPSLANPERDILTAGPVAPVDGRIALDFTHINTMVTISLLPSMDYPKVDGAKISVIGIHGKEAFPITSGTAYIFLPKKLEVSDRITVKLNGTDYIVALTDIVLKEGNLTEFEAGTTYDIKLTIVKNGITATATVAEWEVEAGTGTMKLDIGSGIMAEGFTEDGTLAITGQKLTGTYKYTAAAAAFTPLAPLYWEDLAKEKTDFTALFTPVANGNPEKDIITGSTSVDWGTTLNFDDLEHINAKVKVTLKAGEGFNSISGMTMTVSSLTEATVLYTLTSGMAHVFSPQTVTDGNVLTVTAGDFDYSIALTDIDFEDDTLTSLDAGTFYDIELTVSKSGLGLKLTVKEWNVRSGSGSIKY